jgi:hypothetical protein
MAGLDMIAGVAADSIRLVRRNLALVVVLLSKGRQQVNAKQYSNLNAPCGG